MTRHGDAAHAAASARSEDDPVPLPSGNVIPCVGFGVYQTPPGETAYNAVVDALRVGYRHIDTAQVYRNEADVGRAVAASGLPREKVFVTTKVFPGNFGADKTLAALKESLEKLSLTYVDLVLLHAPGDNPTLREEAWQALEVAHKKGMVRSIGVSNFGVAHLEKLKKTATVPISVNQIEFTPFLQRPDLEEYCQKHDIVLEAYSPLTQGKKLDDPTLVQVAQKHKKTSAQVLLRWCLQRGYVPLPKSTHLERIKENIDLFDFELTSDEMQSLNGLNEDFSGCGWDPIKDHPV